MKLYTPEHTELIEVTTVEPFENGIQVDGMIMGERDPATTDERELGLLMAGVDQTAKGAA